MGAGSTRAIRAGGGKGRGCARGEGREEDPADELQPRGVLQPVGRRHLLVVLLRGSELLGARARGGRREASVVEVREQNEQPADVRHALGDKLVVGDLGVHDRVERAPAHQHLAASARATEDGGDASDLEGDYSTE